MQVGDHGPIFRLRDPHTVQSIKADAARADERRKPVLCHIKHSWRKIGDTYINANDPVGSALSMIWMPVEDALVRCRRCGAISTRSAL